METKDQLTQWLYLWMGQTGRSQYSSSGKSRNMFSVHTISSSMNDVLKRIVPADQFQLEHGMFSEQKLLVRLQNKYERYGTENMYSVGGAYHQTAISMESCTSKWPHTLVCVWTIRHTAQPAILMPVSERSGKTIHKCS